MAKTSNPFAIFANNEVKTATIEALGGAEIKYRELTMSENDNFTKRLVKDYGTDGSNAEIDFDEAAEIKYEKVALMLIEPAVTVEYLKGLTGKASEAINEINALNDANEALDNEGN